ncbi:MAG: site-specific integrase [Acidobacteriaceae bacterium]
MSDKRFKLPAIVSDHDLERIIAYTTTDNCLQNLHDALILVANTELRRGELAGLRWSDVDLDERSLVVSGLRRSTRHAFFSESIGAILLARRQRNPEAELVFGPLTRVERLGWHLRRVSQELGIECTFQTLRRSFAKRLFDSGVDAPVACHVLGVSYDCEFEHHGVPAEATLKRAAESLGEI